MSIGLVDRHGNVTGLRNDGSTNPQVTPIYLLTEALNEMDAAFQTAPNPNPNEDRFAQWRLARSQLVDQFLAVDQGTSPAGPTWTFDNAGVPKFVPTLIDTLRAQIFAHCPTTTTPPYTRCAWARDTFTSELATVVHGPVFAGTMDILEALRTDPASRAQVELLLQYLLYQASQNEALPSMLATANDIIQVMKDDTNLVPLYQALAPASPRARSTRKGSSSRRTRSTRRSRSSGGSAGGRTTGAATRSAPRSSTRTRSWPSRSRTS